MARRRMKRKTPRRRNKSFNIVNAAELYLTTDVLTRNFAGTNPLGFFTGQEYGTTGYTSGGVGRPQAQMGFTYSPGGTSITLPELLGFGSAPIGGVNTGEQLKRNVKNNLIPAIMQYAGVKIGFTVGKKLLSQQRSMINNKILPLVGMKQVVRV
tara:strand:- start:333 stop:794 length:462 start_codon:yes stop_codon:yes gene_type:complete